MRSLKTKSGFELSAPTCFGFAMIGLIWAGVITKSIDGFHSAKVETERLQQSFALVFEENVLRSIGEIDKALLYMRRMIEGRMGSNSLHEIVHTTDILSEIIVQVAVIDDKGIMRATSASKEPAKPIDLSDREHFRVHVDRATDDLFISKPVIGRASKKWSVQVTRRFSKPDGSFGGVVVGSLNPEHFTKFYGQIDLGTSASISLIGVDGIVRSSGGSPSGTLDLGLNTLASPLGLFLNTEGVRSFEHEADGNTRRLATFRKVRGHPLLVNVSIDSAEVYAEPTKTMQRLVAAGLILTFAISLAMWRMAKVEGDRKQAEQHVLRLASEDPLTGLANRRIFQDAATACATREDGSSWAIVCLDVDRFKTINDTLGHRVGDQLLQEVAKRLKSCLASDAVLARLGGDEFAILAPSVGDRTELEKLVDTLVRVAGQPYEIDSNAINCTISLGIAIAPADAKTAEDMIVCGDLALYAAKGAGRNRAAFYNSAMNEEIVRRRGVEVDLRRGLDGDEIEVHFQPIFGPDGKTLTGFEALARWHHPVRGWVPPSVFIDVAEDCGLIVPLGERILREACRIAAGWPSHLRVAVNLSPVQFSAVDVSAVVAMALHDAGLAPQRLEIEITEGLLLENNSRTIDVLNKLRELGVRIAMDDFGTGYSSLSYLQSFPLDKIKIDRSFVRNIDEEPSARSIVEAIVTIAHSLGMVTTAEGVETEAQHAALLALGCDQLQGYLFGKPASSELSSELAENARKDEASKNQVREAA